MGHAVVIASLGALGPLLVKLTARLAREYGRLKGVRREILSLRCELSSMQAAVQKYMMLQDPNIQLKEWISMVRELANDIEDIIDRFIRRLDGGGGRHSGLNKLLGQTALQLKTLGARRGIANQVDKLKARIKHVKELKECYKLDDTAHVVVVSCPREDLAKWMLVQGNNSIKDHHKAPAMEFESDEDWIVLDPDNSDDDHDVLAISYYRSTTSDDEDESTGSEDLVHGFNLCDGGAAALMGGETHE